MRKGKDPDPEPDLDPYFWLMDPDLGGPKTCGSWAGWSKLATPSLMSPINDNWRMFGLEPRVLPVTSVRTIRYKISRPSPYQQCWGSVTFWCGSGSAPLTTDPDPTPDLNPFFSDFKDTKQFFFLFFLINYPQTHYFQSLIYCFKDKFCVKNLFLQPRKDIIT